MSSAKNKIIIGSNLRAISIPFVSLRHVLEVFQSEVRGHYVDELSIKTIWLSVKKVEAKPRHCCSLPGVLPHDFC